MTVAVDQDGTQSAVADATAWCDVRDVEFRTRLSETVNDITYEQELTVQIPRLKAAESIKGHGLGTFVAVMLDHVNRYM